MNPFQVIFWDLSPLYRNILKQLIRLDKKYTGCVFVLQKSLAEWCRCSIRTVKRAISLFIKQGWLGVRLRKRQASMYFLDDKIKQYLFELKNSRKQNFRSENVPSMSPLCSTNKVIDDIDSIQKKESKYRQRGKHEFTEKDKKDLKAEFGEYHYEEARQLYNWSVVEKKLIKPETVYGYFRHLCKKIKNKIGAK